MLAPLLLPLHIGSQPRFPSRIRQVGQTGQTVALRLPASGSLKAPSQVENAILAENCTRRVHYGYGRTAA